VEKDSGGVYDGSKGSLENLTKQRIDLVTDGAAGRGQKQSEVRRKLVPENEAGPSEGVTERVGGRMLENLTRRSR
jgi:hypothetical protein